jgi:CDP-glucose 4,6-dehydratase
MGGQMNWKECRAFITGASGIVGSWLAKRLIKEGTYVVGLIHDADPQTELFRAGDINRIAVINGALENYASLERAINEHEIDTVFHLGAQPIVNTALRNPLPTFETNIRGTWNLLEACRTHACLVQRIVVASSDKAYGEAERLPYVEDMPANGRHPYDVSKSCTDLLAMTYAHTYEMPIAIARCGNIFGGGDLNWSRIVPGTIRSLMKAERPVLRSDGTFVRDYIYVEDVVSAYMLLAAGAPRQDVRGQAFNFSLENRVTVTEIVEAIQRIMGRTDLKPDIRDQVKAEIRDQYLDAGKARRVLGWSPSYSLEQGLIKTIEWYRHFLSTGWNEKNI